MAVASGGFSAKEIEDGLAVVENVVAEKVALAAHKTGQRFVAAPWPLFSSQRQLPAIGTARALRRPEGPQETRPTAER